MRKAKHRFKKGYRFSSFAGEPMTTCQTFTPTGTVSLLLSTGTANGSDADVRVKTGDAVTQGQAVARALHAPIHASVTGVVETVTETRIDILSGKTEHDVECLEGATNRWRDLEPKALRSLIYRSGLPNIEADGIPADAVGADCAGAAITADEVDGLIISLIPDDVLNPAPEAILEGDRYDRFIEGCHILAAAFPQATVTIAISSSYKSIAERVETSFDGSSIDTVLVSNRFPQSHQAVLVPSVTGAPFPVGITAIHTGQLVLDYQTPIHACEAVVDGIPVTHRRIAIAGPMVREPEHIDVPIGTSVAEIVAAFTDAEIHTDSGTESNETVDDEIRVVMDSLMTGKTASADEVVTAETKAIYCIHEARSTELMSFASPGFRKDSYTNTFAAKFLPLKKEINTNIHGERRACLNCSFCTDVCPVGIMPNILHPYVERDLISETLVRFGILKCINCNLCTYVCPSKIPLAQLMGEGKRRLFEEGYVSNLAEINSNLSLKGLDG